MIDWLEELLSMTAAEHVDEDANGESDVLYLGGMAINAVPPGQADKEETTDHALQGQGPSLMGAVDEKLRTENGDVELVAHEPIIPQKAETGEKVFGMRSISPFVETEGKSVRGLSRLMSQVEMPETFDMVKGAVGEWQRVAADSDESVEMGEQKRVETEWDTGLQALYREVTRGTSLLGQAAVGQIFGRGEEAGFPQQSGDRLTVDGLDQAVRRDSRRYDGGMTLF